MSTNSSAETATEPSKLYHLWGDKDHEFFARVDKYGGWPVGMKYVSFYHSGPAGPRECEFGNEYLNTGWWTTVFEADDYYRWKLSDKAIAKIRAEERKAIIRQLGGFGG